MYTIESLKSKLTPVFSDYGIRKAILFGSYAKRTATEKSDIDLLVDSQLKGLRFVGFTEAVRKTIDLPVDILDVTHIERHSRIDREISATGVTIYTNA